MLAAAVAYSAAKIVKISKGQKDFLGQENINKRQTRRNEKRERDREEINSFIHHKRRGTSHSSGRLQGY
jgi:hypothetical protein